ncbi:NAD(P)-binding protein [Backusella circina FSU 941]|nr:NAD(P)-binding protein [Backusella circina FSU 941]
MPFWSKRNFSFEKIPDSSGKIAIVTGSNTGVSKHWIGKASALEMARKNCTVILACRNSEKTLVVVKEIQEETGNKNIEFIQLDLMSLKSVKAFTDEFKSRYSNLHILMNNAGVMMCPFGLSEDGIYCGATCSRAACRIETQFATNHVAHFYLTTLLLPELERSTPSRIVNVSSYGHAYPFLKLDLENISDPAKYGRFVQYARSKIYPNAIHPGIVRSELGRHIADPSTAFTNIISTLIACTTEDGALNQLYAATSPEIEEKKYKGQYFVPYAAIGKPSGVANSENAPKELWEFTEKLLAEKITDYERVSL